MTKTVEVEVAKLGAGPDGIRAPGMEIEVSEEEAEQMFGAGAARPVQRTKVEQAIANRELETREAPEIPDSVADALLDAGYETLSDIEAASDEDLLAVKGIGPKTLEKLREG